ncbi:hypothetical protein CRUP_021825 [Coryphaenoides rupestris]|nr:hypothetical protein CRUP_021825 [Coryphaenoides rupestris]
MAPPPIESVIEKFYGVKPKIQCVHPTKGSDAQTLGQIEICFQPDFILVDCAGVNLTTVGLEKPKPSPFRVCDIDVPVYYPPVE